ncbi:hypothetical protein [Mesorhizobium sp. LNJC394B00]|uniref:hypothetical protein n=1 Tax=Mesorhizobium sp. LNJC394B00 TaxID=1287274 RepID=UPI0012EB6035|nr:hypothetical protein [Mesorhizobium sp. LNJC394B00]
MTTARDLLTAAHEGMTPAEIAAHAIDRADELEQMHQAFNAAASAHNGLVTSLANLVATQKSAVPACRDMQRSINGR